MRQSSLLTFKAEYGVEYKKGDIIVMEPMEATDFECLEDGTQNVVVKYPGANNDKYLGRA